MKIYSVITFFLTIAVLLTPAISFADTTQPSDQSNIQSEGGNNEGKQEENANNINKNFLGLGFGVGISLTIDTGKHDRVKSASVVNGIVRVTEQHNSVARIMLESHYFFKGNEKKFGAEWGYGPFMAIQPGDNEIVDAVALGFMWGFKRENTNSSNNSWNVGIGIVADPNVQVLGDGIVANKPLPAGETEIRYKTMAQYGILILSSFSW